MATECMSPDGNSKKHGKQLDTTAKHFSAWTYKAVFATLSMEHLAIAGGISSWPLGIGPSFVVIPFLVFM